MLAEIFDNDDRVKKIFDNWEKVILSEELTIEEKDEKINEIWDISDQAASDLDALQCLILKIYNKYADSIYLIDDVVIDNWGKKVLLEQSIVTACTGLECYLYEMIPWILKNNKDASKRFLGSIGKPIKNLGKYDFQPLENVSKIFRDKYKNKHFPVFPDMKEFYHDKFEIELFGENEEDFKEIFQVRHCIVHNAGKPDD